MSKPPFRADHVGSLLRPEALKQARSAHQEGRLDAEGLREIEDRHIREAVRRQEALGLEAVTDGEFRRAWWHFDFLAGLEGVEWLRDDKAIQFKGVATKAESVAVRGRVSFGEHPMLAHFRFLRDTAHAVPKMTIPSPSMLHFRTGRAGISETVYPDLDAFFQDAAEAYRQAVQAFYALGCRYLQFDDVAWAYLCSEEQRTMLRERGEDPDALRRIYRDMINHALTGKPADMTITTHVCRGNFRSTWIASGGYEPVAETLLVGTRFDGYFLEYDSERAGGFEPLRFLPKGDKRVILGLVTSKFGELEDRDLLLRRIEEAARHIELDQCCLSPQCGFASTEEGNLLAEEEQWNKLRLVVDVAREVWPG